MSEITYTDADVKMDTEVDEITRQIEAQGDVSPPVSDFEYACEYPGCGVELFYGGRGRKPKRCADHKTTASRNNGPTISRNTRWQQPLADALNAQFTGIGMIAFAFDQFDGQCIIQGAPNLSVALVGVAESNPSVRKALENFVQAGAWAQVATAVAAIAIPIMGHHGLLPAGLKMPTGPKVA